MDAIAAFKALVMGIVEGLAEFLPISSTGHLILAGSLLGMHDDKAKVFDVVIQTGAMLAVVWEYRARFIRVAVGAFTDPMAQRFIANLIVAFIPAAVLGLLFGSAIKHHLFYPVPVAVALVVGGVVILWVERRTMRVRVESVDDMTWRDALKIGLAQSFALIPGTSRSGATIIGGMLFRPVPACGDRIFVFPRGADADRRRCLRSLQEPTPAGCFRSGALRHRFGGGVHQRLHVHPLVVALHHDARFHGFRMVSDRLRRDRPRDGIYRSGELVTRLTARYGRPDARSGRASGKRRGAR